MLSLVRLRSARTVGSVLSLSNYRLVVTTSRNTNYAQQLREDHALTGGQLRVGTAVFACRIHDVGSSYCTTSHSNLRCWKCQQGFAERPTFFCTRCNVVQPPDASTTHFQILDCDPSFSLDTQKLQRRYLQLQRSLHPDNFSQKSKEEQEYSELQSALLNRAYRTLLKPLSRGLYMLELEGMPVEEEGTDSRNPSFLMELMELNEAVEDAHTPEEANRIGQDTKAKLKELTAQIDDTLRKGEHEAAKALLIQMKYFANIEEKVKEQLSKLM